jgi:hypothetical protein
MAEFSAASKYRISETSPCGSPSTYRNVINDTPRARSCVSSAGNVLMCSRIGDEEPRLASIVLLHASAPCRHGSAFTSQRSVQGRAKRAREHQASAWRAGLEHENDVIASPCVAGALPAVPSGATAFRENRCAARPPYAFNPWAGCSVRSSHRPGRRARAKRAASSRAAVPRVQQRDERSASSCSPAGQGSLEPRSGPTRSAVGRAFSELEQPTWWGSHSEESCIEPRSGPARSAAGRAFSELMQPGRLGLFRAAQRPRAFSAGASVQRARTADQLRATATMAAPLLPK